MKIAGARFSRGSEYSYSGCSKESANATPEFNLGTLIVYLILAEAGNRF
jgi:hypothetical protein